MSVPNPASNWNHGLLQRLFARGLGELLVLHVHGDNVMLGQLCLKKNRLTLSDTRYLTGVRPPDLAACQESGLLGMISASDQYQWASLTFHGLNQCRIQVDLSKTRGSRLAAARNFEGEDLLDFVGSVYRGFQLMLNQHFLPVVSLRQVQARDGEWGVAVLDLRMGAIDLAAIRIVNDAVRRATERHLEVDIIEEDVQSGAFEEMFSGFLPAMRPRTVAAQRTEPAPVSIPPSRPATQTARPVVPPTPMQAGIAPVDALKSVLELLHEVIKEVGAPRAFALFEKWAIAAAVARIGQLKRTDEFNCRTVREYFDLIARNMGLAGEDLEIVNEDADTILHEVRNCLYREACRASGMDEEDRWSTCAQAIPGVRAKAAAALDPRLKWTWTSCDRRAGYPCVFELRLGRNPQ